MNGRPRVTQSAVFGAELAECLGELGETLSLPRGTPTAAEIREWLREAGLGSEPVWKGALRRRNRASRRDIEPQETHPCSRC